MYKSRFHFSNVILFVICLSLYLLCARQAVAGDCENARISNWAIEEEMLPVKADYSYDKTATYESIFTLGTGIENNRRLGDEYFEELSARNGDLIEWPGLDQYWPQWPQGISTELYHVAGDWFVLDSVWADYGSGSFGDHNLYFVNFKSPSVPGGENQGGTHTFNATMDFWPEARLASIKGTDYDSEYRFNSLYVPDNDDLPVFFTYSSVADMLGIRDHLERPFGEGDQLTWATKFIQEGISFELISNCGYFGEQTDYFLEYCSDADLEKTYDYRLLKWSDLIGVETLPIMNAPIGRWPEKVLSPDGRWSLRSDSSTDRRSPSWNLYSDRNNKAVIDDYYSWGYAGFFKNSFWALGANLFITDFNDIGNKKMSCLDLPPVNHVQMIGNDNLLMVTDDALIKYSREDRTAVSFLHRAPLPEQTLDTFIETIAETTPELNRDCFLEILKTDVSAYNEFQSRNIPPEEEHNLPEEMYLNMILIISDDWLWNNWDPLEVARKLSPCGMSPVHEDWRQGMTEESFRRYNDDVTAEQIHNGELFTAMTNRWWREWLRFKEPESRKWVAAWRIAPREYIISERINALEYGEHGHIIRVRLQNDPFGTEPSTWINEPNKNTSELHRYWDRILRILKVQ